MFAANLAIRLPDVSGIRVVGPDRPAPLAANRLVSAVNWAGQAIPVGCILGGTRETR